MSKLSSLIKRVERLDLQAAASEAFKETAPVIGEMIVSQLGQGMRSDNTAITPEYRPKTIIEKLKKGQETAFVNLRDQGDYWASIKAMGSGSRTITEASDLKAERIKKKYETPEGKLLKLNGENKRRYVTEQLRPALMRNLKKQLK